MHYSPARPRTKFLIISGMFLTTVALMVGCGGPTPPATQQPLTHEQRVQKIITDLWTPDKDLNDAAVADAMKVKDERIGEALVGVMADEQAWHQPPDEPASSIVDALRYQGWRVDYIWKTHQYRIIGPDTPWERLLPRTPDTSPYQPLE